MIDYEKLPACSVQTCLDFISDKWKILIIRDLLGGTKRFNNTKNADSTAKRDGRRWTY